jgi:hypothetical protein
MKKRTTKLALNVETIRVLTTKETKEVIGAGTTAITCTCQTTARCTTDC